MATLEILMNGCKCLNCGKVAAFLRLGCSCTKEMEKTRMEYGFLIPGSGVAEFIGADDMRRHFEAGGAVECDGKQISAKQLGL